MAKILPSLPCLPLEAHDHVDKACIFSLLLLALVAVVVYPLGLQAAAFKAEMWAAIIIIAVFVLNNVIFAVRYYWNRR